MRFFLPATLMLVCGATALRAQTSVPSVFAAVPPVGLAPGGAATVIELRNHVIVPGLANGTRFVQFDTTLGRFNVELRTDAAPRHAQNFLNYTAAGAYTRTFIHRAASFEGGAVSIVQGGGYTYAVPFATAEIPKVAPIALEYSLANARGTLAAARTTDINSATSEWFFNTRDNSTILGPNNGGGYSVFGRVVGTGMTVVDQIAALPRYNASGVRGAFGEIPLRNSPVGTFNETHLIAINSVREVALFPGGSLPAILEITAQSSAPAVATAEIAGTTLTIRPLAGGTANVAVRVSDTNGNVAQTVVAVTVASGLPVFTTQPVSQTVATGSAVVLSAVAAGAPAFVWQRNGENIPGATNPTLVIRGATAADAGTYRCRAANTDGSATSDPATLAVVNATPADTGRLINLAVRTNAGTGAETLIVGFAVGGAGTSGPKPLLVRGVGPSLAQFGLTGVLADPSATVFQGTATVVTNDNWGGAAAIADRAAQVGAFQLAAADSLDAALAFSPAPESYTVQITGRNNGTGIALAEIYDATALASFVAATPRLTNVSARTRVGTGGDILIAGFVVGGTTAKTVLIRAIGPTLADFGVTGALADPRLQLFSGTTLLRENNDWGGDAQLTTVGGSVGAFALANATSKDAVLLVTLAPGSYTAQVAGADGGTGVALVEVYEVP